MYVLLGDDLIHLDSKASEACEWRCPGIVHIDELIYGRSIDVDQSRMLIVGTSNGTIYTQSLKTIPKMGLPFLLHQESITAIASDSDGSLWAVDGCEVRFISPNSNDMSITSQWDVYQYRSTPSSVATDIIVISGTVIISTENNGVHLINYNLSGNQSVITIVDTHWDTSNFLASNRITDLQMMGNQLLISTENAGINRRDLATSTWLSRWSTANTLASNNILGTSVSDGWLHVLAGMSCNRTI